MSSNDHLADFFVTGGTMLPDAPSYVERQADHDLYENLAQGKYCYVLTARQMGKSSLMVRTAVKLRQAGISAVMVDLTSVGRNLTVDQWYVSTLSWIGHGLEEVEAEVEKFWVSQPLLSPVQRWARALREIILPRFPGQLVIFIDEVDYVQNLPFPMDEFFATIRECYNLRAEDERMRRLTCCLIGVATPSDLIRDKRLTPFNIGQRIELHDFTYAEAAPLAAGLRRENGQSRPLLDRVLYWTGGHPYLTQRLCQAVAGDDAINRADGVDRLCDTLFLSRHAREIDDNLIFVRERLLRGEEDRAGLLHLYAKTLQGKRVEDDGTNPLINTLRLAGITRVERDRLKVRNRIYERVFDEEWIANNMPDAELRRQREAYWRGVLRTSLIGAVILFLVGTLTVVAIRERSRAERESANSRLVAYHAQVKLAQQEMENANIKRAEEILESLMPLAGQDDLRGFEWDYLWQASHRSVQSFDLNNQVVAAAFSTDGKQIAVAEVIPAAGNGKRRYRFSILTRDGDKAREPVEVISGGVFDLAVFADDLQSALVESDENTVKLLDPRSGRTLQTLAGHKDKVNALALAPDGKRAVTADATGALLFWDLANGATSRDAKRRRRAIFWTAFSPDGNRVVTIDSDYVMQIWEPGSGRELPPVTIPESRPIAAIFSPDGSKLLVADRSSLIYICDFRKSQFSARPAAGPIRRMVFSPDGKKLATGSENRTVAIWDKDLNQLATIKGHGANVTSVAWSADNTLLATASFDRSVKIWDVNEEIEANSYGLSDNRLSSYLATALPGDGQLFALGLTADEKLRLLKVLGRDGRREMIELGSLGGKPLFAVFSPRADLVAVGGVTGVVTIRDVNGGKVSTMTAHPQTPLVITADFAPDGKLLVFKYDAHTLTLRDVATGRETRSIRSDIALSERVVFSPDGKWVAAACKNGEVVAWSLDSDLRVVFKGHTDRVSAIAFSPNGSSLATGGKDSTFRLWDARTGRALKYFGQADYIQRIAFSPDGKRLVTGGGDDGTVKIWNAITGDEVMTLHQHAGEVRSLTFSRDGKTLVTSGSDGVVKWFGTRLGDRLSEPRLQVVRQR